MNLPELPLGVCLALTNQTFHAIVKGYDLLGMIGSTMMSRMEEACSTSTTGRKLVVKTFW